MIEFNGDLGGLTVGCGLNIEHASDDLRAGVNLASVREGNVLHDARRDNFTSGAFAGIQRGVESHWKHGARWDRGLSQRKRSREQENYGDELHTILPRGCGALTYDGTPCSRARSWFSGIEACNHEGGLLKSWRPLIHNTERGFEREPCASQPSFLKKLADQGDTMRHAPRRRKSRQRMIRIGGPVASRLGDLHKSGPEGE